MKIKFFKKYGSLFSTKNSIQFAFFCCWIDSIVYYQSSFFACQCYTIRKKHNRGRNAPFFREILSPLISFSNLMIFLITEIEVIDIKFIYQQTSPRIQCFVVSENYLLFKGKITYYNIRLESFSIVYLDIVMCIAWVENVNNHRTKQQQIKSKVREK